MAATARETAGTTMRLIVAHVRAHAGDEGVARLLELAGETRPASELEDERRWSTYEQKVALFDAACVVLDDPDAPLHIGETALDHEVGALVRVLVRQLGSPRMVIANVARACPKFSTVATMRVEELGDDHAVVVYTLDEAKTPHRGDCQLNIGLMRTIGPIFGLPPLHIDHTECQVLGAPACRYTVRWPKRRRSRRDGRAETVALRRQVDALETQIAALQSTAEDLVSSADVDEVLGRIVSRAGHAVRAGAFVLTCADIDGRGTRVIGDGIETDRLDATAAEIMRSPLGGCGDRIVLEIASARRIYGRLAAIAEGKELFPFEERLLASYAQSAAAALDAATALHDARTEAGATAALLDLARALATPSSTARIARLVAAATTDVLGVPAAAVLLWDEHRETLRVAGRSGWSAADAATMDQFALRADTVHGLAGSIDGPTAHVLHGHALGSGTTRMLVENIGAHALAVASVRSTRNEMLGLIVAALGPTQDVERVTSHLVAIGDQAATALDNSILLERIRHEAAHDGLTGLANRTLFDQSLRRAVARGLRHDQPLSVLFIDLDDFKDVNDRLGHGAGDAVLRVVADRLVEAGRAGDVIARIGGDEFTMLLTGIARPDVDRVVARIKQSVAQPIRLGEAAVTVHASIGVACCPDDGTDSVELLRAADRSMYRTKRAGRTPLAVDTATTPG